MEELVTGSGGLLSRGLLEAHATRYGALPRTKQERATLAGILNDYVRAHFSEYAKSPSGAGAVGVPGFRQELSGVVHIWKRATGPQCRVQHLFYRISNIRMHRDVVGQPVLLDKCVRPHLLHQLILVDDVASVRDE